MTGPFLSLPDTSLTLELPGYEGWPPTVHELERRDALAINTALAARRPLLVEGEPGTGKTQLAHAAAVALKRRFVHHTLDAHTEAPDLFWRVDAVRRLSEAQLVTTLPEAERESTKIRARLDERRFVEPGVLWWGFRWDEAADTERENRGCDRREPPSWAESPDSVVLLDEIDKADPVLPNALLEVLGTRRFPGPPGRRAIEAGGAGPLVVITTNKERELADAFVRRCVVLKLRLGEGTELRDKLVVRGRRHLERSADLEAVPAERKRVDTPVLQAAAERLVAQRNDYRQLGLPPPGQAEFLDLVQALWRLRDEDAARLELMDEIAPFVLEKRAAEDP